MYHPDLPGQSIEVSPSAVAARSAAGWTEDDPNPTVETPSLASMSKAELLEVAGDDGDPSMSKAELIEVIDAATQST